MSTIKERKDNIKGLWANPRARMTLLAMSAVGIVLLAVFFFNRTEQRPTGTTGTRGLAAPNIEARPGTVNDPAYVQAVRDENQERLQQAQQEGRTVLPTLEGNPEAPSLDPLNNVQAPTAPQTVQPQPVVTPPVPTPGLAPTPGVAAQGPSQAQAAPRATSRDIMGTERYKSLEEQAKAYMATFVPQPAGQEFAYNGQLPPPAPAPAVAEASSSEAAASAAARTSQGARFVRAGTIVPAVLLTAINSATPGPVLAQITSGPLAGARLIGSFQASEKQVVVQFRTLSMPTEGRSFSVNAYAVNEKLGTGLATDVDNHYFRRYGLLLAAGFIEGYGNAIGRSGTTTTIGNSGNVVVVQDELDSSKISKVALGQAGARVAGGLRQETRVRPTVKVEGKDGAGVPIGLLFMNDF